MLQWEDQDLLAQLLMLTHMTWIRGVDPWIILRTYEELTEKTVRDENDTLVCDQCDKDGNLCQFTGTPVSMGQHKWIVHQMCNPAKALMITNECPACRSPFIDLKSAR